MKSHRYTTCAVVYQYEQMPAMAGFINSNSIQFRSKVYVLILMYIYLSCKEFYIYMYMLSLSDVTN